MNREELFEIFDQLIKIDDTFLNKKTKLYCEHCLNLGKEYIDSIRPGLFEECEKYINKMEDFENQNKLGLEANDICDEIYMYIGEIDIMRIYKAKVFCEFILCYNIGGVDTTGLKEKCKKYLENFDDFSRMYNYEMFNNLGIRCLFDLEGSKIQNISKK